MPPEKGCRLRPAKTARYCMRSFNEDVRRVGRPDEGAAERKAIGSDPLEWTSAMQ